MAFDNNVMIVGNVTRDPELRFTPSGAAVCNFGVAWNQRDREGNDTAHFFDVACWRTLAENVAESLTKGSRVVVYGRLDYRTWEGQNGEKRSKVEIVADEVSPSLRWASAEINRNERGDNAGDGGSRGGGGGGMRSVPSNEPPAYNPDEEPF